MTSNPFSVDIKPDWQSFVACIERRGTPDRVHFIELFLDPEVQAAVCQRFEILDGLDPEGPYYPQKRQIRLQRFLGYDYVRSSIDALEMPLKRAITGDTAELPREGGRGFMEEHEGPITSWKEFETYPWPDPEAESTRALEWYQENLPDDMCILAFGRFAHCAEYLTWLMGYETLCYALYDQRELVRAISERITEISRVVLRRILEFDRVKIVWGSDDMGFKTATLISPDDLREFVLPGHKLMAQMSHDAGRPYLLHSCGKLNAIMADLIEDVRIDALHSFQDTIVSAISMKEQYGDAIAVLGGIDLDFMCRATPEQIRERVRYTLEKCMPGGGYCLGTGNTVANYIPLENYLAMLDEGRRFKPAAGH